MRFELADRVVDVVGEPEAIEVVGAMFAGVGEVDTARVSDVTVHAFARDRDGGARPSIALRPWYFHGLVQVSRGEGWVRVDDGATFADVRADGREAHVFVAAIHSDERAALRQVTLRVAMLAALRAHDVFELHGGLVESAPGEGCLVVGASGSGKSTFTSSLAESGFAPLGDDITLVWRAADGLRLSAVPRPFFLGDRAIEAMPRLRAFAQASSFHGEKWRVEPRLAWSTPTTRSLRPSRLLMPEIAAHADASTVTVMSHAEAFGELLGASAMLLDDEPARRDRQLAILKELVHEHGAQRLRLGRDLLASPVAVARALLATSPSL